MTMAAAAASSSSSLFGVYPNPNPNPNQTHLPPRISHLRFSNCCSKSLRFACGGVQFKAMGVTSKLVMMDETSTTTVDVHLGDRSYPIYIGSGLLHQPRLLQRSPLSITFINLLNYQPTHSPSLFSFTYCFIHHASFNYMFPTATTYSQFINSLFSCLFYNYKPIFSTT